MKYRQVYLFIFLLMLFLMNLIPHINHMPQHVDSWITITETERIVQNKRLEFIDHGTGEYYYYPPGSFLISALITQLFHMDIIFFSKIFPAFALALAGFLSYFLAKELFSSEEAAIAVVAMFPLAISTITTLGLYYFVPVSYGILLSLFYFNMLVRNKNKLAASVLILLFFTHISSFIFSVLTTILYFIFSTESLKKKKIRLIQVSVFALITLIAVSFLMKKGMIKMIMFSLFTFEKQQPYIDIKNYLPLLSILLMGAGLYYLISEKNKGTRFLVPIFTFMVLNMFIYMKWKGFFIVYRRIFTYFFILMPFIVAYGIYKIGSTVNRRIKKRYRKYNFPMILLLLLMLPVIIKAYYAPILPVHEYVTPEEDALFRIFGQSHPGESLIANYLESYSLYHYNLKPVQLSPAHGVDTLYFKDVGICYFSDDTDCFARFMNATGYEYVYASKNIDMRFFSESLRVNNLSIYQFDWNKYNSLNST